MKRSLSSRTRTVLALSTVLAAVIASAASPMRAHQPWSAAELQVMAGLTIDRLGPPPNDPSNAVEGEAGAIALGRQLFSDTRFSRNWRRRLRQLP